VAASSSSSPPSLSLATWNIHKGFSQFNRRVVVHELREKLRTLGADIVFLQEVQGEHLIHSQRHRDWPDQPQHQFLAEQVWSNHAYGQNMVYDHGHHGNAILSRFPILEQDNQDVTHYRFDRRGLLHCKIAIPNLADPVHCVSVHLSLFGGSRRFQLAALVERIESIVPAHAPLVIAGDFNDWRNHADKLLAKQLSLSEAFSAPHGGPPARSFPAQLPLLRLDRIYLRGLDVIKREVHQGGFWSSLSDHAALFAHVKPTHSPS
jgi:endonuclease/exonuclease/phosphatase family metal-dependent hydrolase